MDDITGFRRGRLGFFFLHKRGVRKRREAGFFLIWWTYKATLRRLPSSVVMTGSRRNIKRTMSSSDSFSLVQMNQDWKRSQKCVRVSNKVLVKVGVLVVG